MFSSLCENALRLRTEKALLVLQEHKCAKCRHPVGHESTLSFDKSLIARLYRVFVHAYASQKSSTVASSARVKPQLAALAATESVSALAPAATR